MSLLKVMLLGFVCGIICFTCIMCNMNKHRVNTSAQAIAQIYKY